jgi:Zn-dependent peptidase ImmA (M78 family)/transcriptional regulator with XRE-family HTH domain
MDAALIAKNAKRLRLGQDMTQAQVAKKSGVSVPTYSKIESGTASPRMDTLYKVASALGASIHELFAQVRDLKVVRFRAQKKLKRRDQVLAKAANWLDDFNYLLQEVKSDSVYALADIPSKLKKVRAIDRPLVAAGLARKSMGLNDKEPIHDITGLFAANGIKVLTYTLKSDAFFGMSIGEAEGGPAIVVNVWDRIPVERWIFSAAHELGHLLLHMSAYNVDVIEEDKEQENEADRFASEFLMPQKGFGREWQETAGLALWHRILKIKRIYHVSYKTVLYRLRELGVFSDDVWLQANMLLKKLYPKQRITKSFEPERLQEYDFVTDWLDRLVREAVRKDLITLNRASEILGISLQEARQRASLWAEEKVASRA